MNRFWNTVFGFVTVQVPKEPAGDYQTGGLLLRVAGWYEAISALLGLLLLVIIVPIMLVIGGAIASDLGGDLPGGFIAILAVAMVFGLLIGAAITIAWLYWIGWILERWAEADPIAVRQMRLFAIINLALFALSMMASVLASFATAVSGESTTSFAFGGLFNPLGWLFAALMVWMLVLAGRPELAGVFQEAERPSA